MKPITGYGLALAAIIICMVSIILMGSVIVNNPDYLLASITGKPKPWKAVTVVYNDDDVAECSLLDAVDARAAFGNYSPSATKKAEELAIKRLRIATAKIDGDTVLVLRVESGEGRARAWGEAYRCGESE